jgi:hypothetical protein
MHQSILNFAMQLELSNFNEGLGELKRGFQKHAKEKHKDSRP